MKFQFKKIVLKNGLRLIVIPQKESPSVTAGIFVQAGSAYESKANSGISHFLEHMCFKGTKKRPRPMDISSELESLGASYNAFTSRDLTGYWAKVAHIKLDEMFDILADIYQGPVFDEKEIEKEKGVIIEEINMYEDQPRAKLGQELEFLMYHDQPAGWNVAGTKKTVRSISKEDFLNYRSKFYNAKKTLIVIAGNVDIVKARRLAENYFSKLPAGKIIFPKKVLEFQKRPQTTIIKKNLDQTHFNLSLKSFSVLAPAKKRFALGMLSEILGGGMSSRLFQKVREEMGAAYYVGSEATLYGTHGYLEVFAGVNHLKTDQAISAIMEELRKISREKVSDAEIKRVKDHNIGTFLLSLETSSSLGFFAAEQEIETREVKTPDQIIKNMLAVTKGDILRVAKEIVRNNRLNFAIIGPYGSGDQSRFKKMIKL